MSETTYLHVRLDEPRASHLEYARAKSEQYWDRADQLDKELPGVRFWLADLGYAAFSGFRKTAIVANAAMRGALHMVYSNKSGPLFPNE